MLFSVDFNCTLLPRINKELLLLLLLLSLLLLLCGAPLNDWTNGGYVDSFLQVW